MANTAQSLHLYDLIVQDVFQWAMCLFHSIWSSIWSWIKIREAFYPPCRFSQSSRHNRLAKVGLHHKPSNLPQLVCLDANLLQLYICMLSEIILKCQSVLFITLLGEKLMAETANSLHLYDLIVQDVFQWAMFLFHAASSYVQS